MAIKIKEIFESDTLRELIEKLNFNFDQITVNGGGLRGFRGDEGEQGLKGNTGQSGSKINSGTFPPLNDASSLQVLKDNILNLQLDDYYLYLGADDNGDSYFLGDLYQIVESSGTVVGFDDFELLYQGNIRGPQGAGTEANLTTPALVSFTSEKSIKRNPENTLYDITGLPSGVQKAKPIMPKDTRLNLSNVDLLDETSDLYMIDNPSNILLLDSYRNELSGNEGLAVDFIIEDREFSHLGLTTQNVLESRKATIKYSRVNKDANNASYVLNFRNDYESDGDIGNGYEAITGDMLFESSLKGDFEINYGKNFIVDINSNTIGNENGYTGKVELRAKRNLNLLNVENGSSAGTGRILIAQKNEVLNSAAGVYTSSLEFKDSLITAQTYRNSSPGSNTFVAPEHYKADVSYFTVANSANSTYPYTVSKIKKNSHEFLTFVTSSGETWMKSTLNEGTDLSESNRITRLSNYILRQSTSGNLIFKSGIAETSGESRSTSMALLEDALRLRRYSETSGGLNGNISYRLPVIEFRDDSNSLAFEVGGGSDTSNPDEKYTNIRALDDYSIMVELNAADSKMILGDTANDTERRSLFSSAANRFTFLDNITVSNKAVNGSQKYIRFSESPSTFQGGYISYNPATGTSSDSMILGVHNANDTLTGNDIPAISVKRSTGHVGIGLADANDISSSYELTVGRSNFLIGKVTAADNQDNFVIAQNYSSGAELVLSSIGGVKIALDTNDNDANSRFDILSNSNSVGDNGVHLLSVIENGSGSLTGNPVGTMHFTEEGTTWNSGITWGNSSSVGTTGIFATRTSSTSYINIMTSDNNSGRQNRLAINQDANIDMIDGSEILIGKGTGNDSYIRFKTASGGSDPGYIRHYNDGDNGLLDITASDNNVGSTDKIRLMKGPESSKTLIAQWDMNGLFSNYGDMLLTSDSAITNDVNLTIRSNNDGKASLDILGNSQGSSRIFVGQSSSFGGGIAYNGDNVDSFPFGSTLPADYNADYITFYRRSSSTDQWTARFTQSSNDWEFREDVRTRGGYFTRSSSRFGALVGTSNTSQTNPIFFLSGSAPSTTSDTVLGSMTGIGWSDLGDRSAAFIEAGMGDQGLYGAFNGSMAWGIESNTTNFSTLGVNNISSLTSGGGDIRNIKAISMNSSANSFSRQERVYAEHGIFSVGQVGWTFQPEFPSYSDDLSINSRGDVVFRADTNINETSGTTKNNAFYFFNSTNTNTGVGTLKISNEYQNFGFYYTLFAGANSSVIGFAFQESTYFRNQLRMTNNADLTVESGSDIVMQGDADIRLTGTGDIQLEGSGADIIKNNASVLDGLALMGNSINRTLNTSTTSPANLSGDEGDTAFNFTADINDTFAGSVSWPVGYWRFRHSDLGDPGALYNKKIRITVKYVVYPANGNNDNIISIANTTTTGLTSTLPGSSIIRSAYTYTNRGDVTEQLTGQVHVHHEFVVEFPKSQAQMWVLGSIRRDGLTSPFYMSNEALYTAEVVGIYDW